MYLVPPVAEVCVGSTAGDRTQLKILPSVLNLLTSGRVLSRSREAEAEQEREQEPGSD